MAFEVSREFGCYRYMFSFPPMNIPEIPHLSALMSANVSYLAASSVYAGGRAAARQENLAPSSTNGHSSWTITAMWSPRWKLQPAHTSEERRLMEDFVPRVFLMYRLDQGTPRAENDHGWWFYRG